MPNKYRKCRICKTRCEVSTGIVNGLDFVCGVDHLAELGLQRLKKDRKKAVKEWNAETRRRKAAAKPLTKWLDDAQRVFNAFIRERDDREPCISCGAIQVRSYARYRGDKGWDAGHFRTVGACSALRFDERNVHKQCIKCNQHDSGNRGDYRAALAKKLGEAVVQELERTNPVRRWTIEEAKQIKAEYKQKLKSLKEQSE